MLPDPPLLVISDRRQARLSLPEIAEAAFRGGARWFSLREKDMPAASRRALLERLIATAAPWDATIGIHDDEAAAAATGAALHLPAAGDAAAARRRLSRALIGASAHGEADAAAKLRAGVDYVTLSPVFLTASKPGYGPALGLEGLARMAGKLPGRIIALGGIGYETAAACLRAGADGIAVMGEIMRADDPEAATRSLITALAGGKIGAKAGDRR